MVYLLKMVIFHGYVSHKQMVHCFLSFWGLLYTLRRTVSVSPQNVGPFSTLPHKAPSLRAVAPAER